MDEIETRKLVKLGKSSIVVSLPKGWTEVMGLKRGDEVRVEQLGDGTLKIIPRDVTPSKGREIRFDISKFEDKKLLERLFMGFYLEGAERIIFHSSTNDLKEVKNVAKNSLGLVGEGEILEKENELVLVVGSKTEKFSMSQLISEMFGSLLSMFSELKTLLSEKQKDQQEKVQHFERKVDSLYHFALRKLISAQAHRGIVKDIGLKSPQWILGNRLVIKSIEQTADILSNLSDSAISLMNKKIDEENEETIISFIERIEDVIPGLINCFRERDPHLANSLFKRIKDIQSEIHGVLGKEHIGVAYNEFLTRLDVSLEPFVAVLEVVFNRSTSEELHIEGIETLELETSD